MNIPSIFELNSVKDQISLLSVLTSHIDWEEELKLEDYEVLLKKMDTTVKNLTKKREEIENLLKE